MRNKKKNRILLLVILLLTVTVGFAALATTLKINGTTGIKKNTWDVHWANVGDILKTETTIVNQAAAVDSNDNTLVNFNVLLTVPGDYYEFQVDAVNAGTLDAMANIVSKTTVPSYASLTVEYADGEEISKYDLLAKAPDPTADPPVYTTERVKVRIEFLSDIDPEDLEEIGDGESIDIEIDVPYDQADDNAKDRHPVPELIPGGRYAVPMDTARQIGVDTIEANESTNDYTTLVYESGSKQGQQREVFAAFQLDDQNVIQHAYVCIVKDGVHCFSNEAEYNTNKDLLYDLYGTRAGALSEAFGCQTSSYKTSCSGTYYEYASQGHNLDPSIECSWEYRSCGGTADAEWTTDGSIGFTGDTRCSISSEGSVSCFSYH